MSVQSIATVNMIQILQDEIKLLKQDKTIDIRFDDKNPASVYGGTWTKVTGAFLYGAGGGYGLGAEGGEAEHTLTIEEIPSHRHNVRTTINAYLSTGTEFTGAWTANHFGLNGHGSFDATRDYQTLFADNVGGGKSHNNMPPYVAVNIWKKIID